MSNPIRIEVNCETGEVTEIELTDAEVAELNVRAEAWAAQQAAEAAEAAQKEIDRQAGIATLKSLGLTDAQISALLG
jgi:hypothetical protein